MADGLKCLHSTFSKKLILITFFGGFQTNKPLQFTEIQFLLTAAKVHQDQQYCMHWGEKKKNTHTCHEHAQYTQVHMVYWNQGGIVMFISRNFGTVLLANHKKIHSSTVVSGFHSEWWSFIRIHISDTNTQRSSRKFPKEYTIKTYSNTYN